MIKCKCANLFALRKLKQPSSKSNFNNSSENIQNKQLEIMNIKYMAILCYITHWLKIITWSKLDLDD